MKSKNKNGKETNNKNDNINRICRHIDDREAFIWINNGSDSKELDQLIRIAYKSEDEFKNTIKALKHSIKKSQDYDADIVSYYIKIRYTNNVSNNQLFLNTLYSDINESINETIDENYNNNNINDDKMIDNNKFRLSDLLTNKSYVFNTIQLYVKVDLNFEGLTSYILLYSYENRSHHKIISNQK